MSIATATTKTPFTPGPPEDAGGALVRAVTARANLARIALLGAAFVWLFSDWLWAQCLWSSESQDWNHSYFLPVIGLYMLWQHRRGLACAPVVVFWPGLAILALAIACYVFFLVGFSNRLGQGYATILALFGVVLLMAGPRVMEFAFFPVTYLLLGVSIPEKVQIFMTFRLQQIATQGAYVVLSALGVETDLQGNILEITGGDGTVSPLNVAEACSGLSMLIAFVALGVAVALVGLRQWWQRVVLLMMAVPVAVGLNVSRIAVLGLVTLVDPDLSAGEAHALIGTLLLVPGLGVYLLIAWALKKSVGDARATPPPPAVAGPVAEHRATREPGRCRVTLRGVFSPAVVVCLVLLTASAAGLHTAVSTLRIHLRKLPIQPERKMRSLPGETLSWVQVGQDRIESAEIAKELGTDNTLSRVYREKPPHPPGRPAREVELHIPYYTGMIDTVPHVADRCMVGAGWRIVTGAQVVPVRLESSSWRRTRNLPAGYRGPRTVTSARLSSDPRYTDAPGREVVLPYDLHLVGAGVEGGGGPPHARPVQDLVPMRVTDFADKGGSGGAGVFVGYFFIANNRLTSNAEDVRLLAFDLKDDYAYYAKVQVTSAAVGSAQELGEVAGGLLSELLPEIMRCLPDWVQVDSGLVGNGESRSRE